MEVERIWRRYGRSFLWVLGFVVVVRVALAATAPAGSPDPPTPRLQVSCPPSAPNAAAGCLTVNSP